MQLYRGMDIGTAKLPAGRAARHPAPPARRARRHRRGERRRATSAPPGPTIDGIHGRRWRRRPRRRLRALRLSGAVRLRRSRAPTPRSARGSSASTSEHGPGILLERLRDLDPAAAATIDARNPRRLIRALEIASRSEVVTPSLPSAPRVWRPSRILHLRRDREQLVVGAARAGRADVRAPDSSTRSRRSASRDSSRAGPRAAASGTRRRSRCSRGDVDARARRSRRPASRRASTPGGRCRWFRRYADAETLDVTGADRGDLSELARRIVP